MSTPPTGQGSAPDRKHGSNSGSISEGEQHGLANVQDGKQHAPDGVVSSEELHNFVSQVGSETEQSNRNQVAPSQQQNVSWEEAAQRQVDERVPHAEARQRLAIEEESPPPEIITSAAFQLAELANPENSYPYATPQNHEPLTAGLAFDFSSLRAEVQHFFERMNNLGGHPTEKQISVLLSSGAVVVAAAMACEVARRQARRTTPRSPFAVVPKLEFANEGEGLRGAGLPNFGQFSAFR